MDNMHEASSWRSLLGQLIKNVKEREALASILGVRPVTLMRWVNGSARPRDENMSQLVKAIPPADAAIFMRLIAREFPDLGASDTLKKRTQSAIPPEFYGQILRAHALTPRPMCRQVIQDLVLRQAIEQLDPERLGMSISIVTFVHPLEGWQVRSMREIGGVGTPPWSDNLAQRTILFGAESLVGYAMTNMSCFVVPNRTETTFFPVHWAEHEQSTVAIPILQHGKVAGGLIAASAVPNYFMVGYPSVSLLEDYARLAGFLFEKEEFFEPGEIALGFMPDYELQVPYFRNFSRLVSQQFRLEQVRGGHFTLEQAQSQVWREIEEALLQVYLQTAHF